MASLKMIFLATFLLIALVGRSSAGTCHTNSDCPPCDAGDALCVEGTCSCTIVAQHKLQDAHCKTDNDCAKLCPGCSSYCANHRICICSC